MEENFLEHAWVFLEKNIKPTHGFSCPSSGLCIKAAKWRECGPAAPLQKN